MRRPAVFPALEADGPCEGPIAARVRQELANAGIEADEVAVAERSPYGQRALRVRFGRDRDGAARLAAERLAAMPWVGDVAAIPPNVYLKLPAIIMREWSSAASMGRRQQPRRLTIRHADPETLASEPLDVLRHVCTARSIAALLRSVGCDVSHEILPLKSSNAFFAHSEVRVRLWTGEASECETSVSVAGVDLPQGKLRARSGGVLQVGDLLRELDGGQSGEALVLALAAFLMLSSPRTVRLKLDEAKLVAEVRDWQAIIAAADIRQRGTKSLAASNEAQVANILLALDGSAAAARKALSELDPYYLIRHLRGLALSADAHLAASDPLRQRVAVALREGFANVALENAFDVNTADACEMTVH